MTRQEIIRLVAMRGRQRAADEIASHIQQSMSDMHSSVLVRTNFVLNEYFECLSEESQDNNCISEAVVRLMYDALSDGAEETLLEELQELVYG